MKVLLLIVFLFGFLTVSAQDKPVTPPITVRITKAAGNIYFLDCEGEFGGGNVAASIGDDAFCW